MASDTGTTVLKEDTRTAPEINQPNSLEELEAAAAQRDDAIQLEQIFEVLSNERRRLVLQYLRQHSGDDSVDFRTLVDNVAALENDTTSEELDSSNRKCVYTALRQTHLPKLDTLGIVDFDRRRGSVELNDKAEDIFQYMNYTPERELFWSRVYLGVAIIGGVTALLLATWIGPFGAIPLATLAILITSVIGILSLVQMRQSSNYDTLEDDSN